MSSSGQVEAVASLQLEMTGGVYASVDANARGLYRSLVEVTGSEGVLISENGLTVDRPVEVVAAQGWRIGGDQDLRQRGWLHPNA